MSHQIHDGEFANTAGAISDVLLLLRIPSEAERLVGTYGTYEEIGSRGGDKSEVGRRGMGDLLCCQDCGASWKDLDVDLTWTDDPEYAETTCPSCGSDRVVREERG